MVTKYHRCVRKYMALERLRVGREAIALLKQGAKFKDLVPKFGRSRMWLYKCVLEAESGDELLL